ncbi:P-loop containing nucleoside triphosphate hydrolase protein [Dioszegia hungarica]|uniref:P-loop containing nucleoside triphosphate hydrolase protein n=1 Tax=Dioszegia hungarica TaxID=4972 RepID=A0AA38H2D0_9TREE|nr:P-loop containing nucleoside triphosphate hydrolase protein [Dioszegia hungarica]KAI9632391.1 P-loop containing nucleoside triphosphate hydrolase protein [Dioszegia hungarica]
MAARRLASLAYRFSALSLPSPGLSVVVRRRIAQTQRRASSTAHALQLDNHDATPLSSAPTFARPPPTPRDSSPTSGEAILPAVVLRDYQHDAIQACLDALSSGLTRIGVSSPTGSGKTTMFMHLIPLIASPEGSQDGRGRTLILVGSVELANQAEAAARRLLGEGYSVEVEQAGRRASGRADVTIATYQTLNNVERLRKLDPRLFKLVIVDEAHHAAAISYLRMLHYFNQDVELPELMSPIEPADHGNRVPIVGFSATFSRPDQLALSAVFEKIVYHREITSMLEEGWLSPVRSTSVKCNLNLRTVELNSQGDFNAASLASHLNTPDVNNLVVGTYLHRASDRRSTLVFCVDLTHVADLTQAFRDAGVDARSVSSLSRPHERKETIRAFSSGEFPVLINCEVLTEGTDIPQIDCIILARPTKSKNLLAQMVGRGLRLCPETGKTECYLIDIVDNVSRSNGMLVSPTLWGLSHDDMAEDQRRAMEGEQQQHGEETASVRPGGGGDVSGMKVTYLDHDDPFRLAKKGDAPLAVMSNSAWVNCGKSRYILELLDQGYMLVEPSPAAEAAAWSVNYRQKLPAYLGHFSPKVRQVALADTLERALQTADRYAEKKVGRELFLKLSRYAPWRHRPPSPRALEQVIRMKGDPVRDAKGNLIAVNMMGRLMPVEKITAGHVASYLCAANHGGVGARKSMDSAERTKETRKLAKEEKARKLAERNLALPS